MGPPSLLRDPVGPDHYFALKQPRGRFPGLTLNRQTNPLGTCSLQRLSSSMPTQRLPKSDIALGKPRSSLASDPTRRPTLTSPACANIEPEQQNSSTTVTVTDGAPRHSLGKTGSSAIRAWQWRPRSGAARRVNRSPPAMI